MNYADNMGVKHEIRVPPRHQSPLRNGTQHNKSNIVTRSTRGAPVFSDNGFIFKQSGLKKGDKRQMNRPNNPSDDAKSVQSELEYQESAYITAMSQIKHNPD